MLELDGIGSLVTFLLVFASLVSLTQVTRRFAAHPLIHDEKPEMVITPKSPERNPDQFAKIHPNPIWMTDLQGGVTWQNDACTGAVQTLLEITKTWCDTNKTQGRTCINGDTTHWFDVSTAPLNGKLIWFATPADGEVRAEDTRVEFVQTLAKTFAQLSTGLAIFDKQRCLALFNPALLELTGLPFETLSQRPTLASFLDTLRSNGLLPEPRNYAEWRNKIAKLEAAAENGSYCEVWELPEGVSYRITGKPHPGGAIAFLVEDISQEVARTRAVRHELNLFEAVYNSISPLCAVFDETGALIMSNTAFDEQWGEWLTKDGSGATILDCLPAWQRSTIPNPAWGDLRDYVGQMQDRAEWTATLHKITGQPLLMRCIPLPGRLTMVEFSDTSVAKKMRAPLLAHG